MMPAKRREAIRQIVNDRRIVSIGELSSFVDASEMTVRRDLERLEKDGVLQRCYGGAAAIEENGLFATFYEREKINKEVKERIGRRATELISEGDVLFLDASTTTLAMARQLTVQSVTCVTTGLYLAAELVQNSNASVVTIGGSVEPKSISTVGHTAVKEIQQYQATKAVLSTRAFDPGRGASEPSLPVIETKRAMVDHAQKVILMVDHSKFSPPSMGISIPIESVDVVITDDQVAREDIAKLKTQGVDVIIA